MDEKLVNPTSVCSGLSTRVEESVKKLISNIEMQPFGLLFGITFILFTVFHKVEFWGHPKNTSTIGMGEG